MGHDCGKSPAICRHEDTNLIADGRLQTNLLATAQLDQQGGRLNKDNVIFEGQNSADRDGMKSHYARAMTTLSVASFSWSFCIREARIYLRTERLAGEKGPKAGIQKTASTPVCHELSTRTQVLEHPLIHERIITGLVTLLSPICLHRNWSQEDCLSVCTYLWERKWAVVAGHWPAPAGSARHWG